MATKATGIPFDKDNDYGMVSPVTNGAMYWQKHPQGGGAHYDVHHNEVDIETGNILTEANPEPAPKKAPVRAPSQPRLSQKQKEAAAAAEDGDDDAGEAAEETSIDLKGWHDGSQKYQWFEVKKAIMAQYGKTPKNAVEGHAIVGGKG